VTTSRPRPRDRALSAFLVVQALTMAAVGVCYVVLSARAVTGTTTRYLFDLIPQRAWGIAFLIAAVTLAAAVDLRRWAFAGVVLVAAQAAWTGALATQLVLVRNATITAPLIVWAGVLATNLVILGVLVPRERE
jgi:hypothetical protein